VSTTKKNRPFNYSKYLATIYQQREKLRCCTFVAKAGARGWFCVCCPVPHHVSWRPPWKRRQSYEKYVKPMIARRLASGVCIVCGESVAGSRSRIRCVKHYARALENQRRWRQRRFHEVKENLYGYREDFKKEDIRIELIR
jgi:hypothetical protein